MDLISPLGRKKKKNSRFRRDQRDRGPGEGTQGSHPAKGLPGSLKAFPESKCRNGRRGLYYGNLGFRLRIWAPGGR